jgi:hypothetical protein
VKPRKGEKTGNEAGMSLKTNDEENSNPWLAKIL